MQHGQELLHTYGDLSDADLLGIYGFVEEPKRGKFNPFNTVSSLSYQLSQRLACWISVAFTNTDCCTVRLLGCVLALLFMSVVRFMSSTATGSIRLPRVIVRMLLCDRHTRSIARQRQKRRHPRPRAQRRPDWKG